MLGQLANEVDLHALYLYLNLENIPEGHGA